MRAAQLVDGIDGGDVLDVKKTNKENKFTGSVRAVGFEDGSPPRARGVHERIHFVGV